MDNSIKKILFLGPKGTYSQFACEKFKEKLFKLLAFIHLLRNQAVTFGKRKEQVVCMNFKILMLKNNLNMGYCMYYTYICRHIKYDIYMYITK